MAKRDQGLYGWWTQSSGLPQFQSQGEDNLLEM